MKITPPNLQHRRLSIPRLLTTVVALTALLGFLSAPGWAQTVTMRANPLRITVPLGVASSNFATVTIVAANLTEPGTINFAVTGVPAGGSAQFTNSIASNGTHTATLIFTTDTTVTQGTHEMAIEAAGDASYRLPIPIICSHIWSGNNFTNGTSTNWNSAGNWQGGSIPGAADSVVFRDLGATSANTGPTNVIVAANTEVGSLRFAQEQASATRYYNLEILTGATLAVTGPGGFAMLRDSKVPLVSQAMDVKISGGGRLVVSNATANFASLIDGQLNATLDLRDLDNLYVDVRRVPLGDYRAYPNFYTNGWVGGGTGNEVSRFAPQIWLARTNVIKAAHVDPNNYDDLGQRDYSLTIGNYSRQGTTANLRFSLGYSNAFFLDSLCFGQALAGGSGNNYNFLNAGSYALFRGIGGLDSRLSVFAIADAASPEIPANANVRGQVNLSNGTVDALVDRLFMGIDRTNNNGQMTVQATLTLANGIFDANEAYLGYQRSGNNQGSDTSTGFAGPEGTVNVNSNATFRVNRNLHLGYTTASTPAGTSSPERASGRVVVTTGTLMVSNVVVGGITKLSTNNYIIIGGGRLILTNDIGAADAPLATLTSTNGSQWTLHGIASGHTNIFVKTLNVPTIGAKTRVHVPSLANVTSYPITIPVISYANSSPNYNGLEFGTLPSGVVGISIIENVAQQTIDFTFDTNQPKVLVWRGTVDNNWDTVTTNWVRQSDGLPSKFTDGDSVVFDDTATGATSINVVGTVVPGQTAAASGVLVSNSVFSYAFTGGNIAGGATVRKVGSAALTMDATATTAMEILGGTLLGSGNVGPTFVGHNATMTGFLGGITGGLSASNGMVSVSGTVSGGLTLLAGALTNNGTINGTVSLATGTYLTNGNTMNVTLPWTVPADSTVVNNGTVVHTGAVGANQGLTLNGTLKGTGRITQSGFQASSDVRVTVGSTGQIMIGNEPNEIATTTIAVRLDFQAGAVTTFDVDTATPSNDRINLQDGFIQGKVNFGVGNNNGATFVINRIAGPSFNTSSTLNLFDLTANNPDNLNPAIPGFTPAPAPSLVWDVTQMLTNLTLRVSEPPALTNIVSDGTNLVFSWPETARGWRLERQISTLDVGLSTNPTNWTTVFNSLGGTNLLYYPFATNNDYSVYFFRSIQPVASTNPATFFRLSYP